MRVISTSVTVPLAAIGTVVAIGFAPVGCSRIIDPPPDQPTAALPRDKSIAFFGNEVDESSKFAYAGEMICEAAGSHDTDDVRLQWRLARRPYEMVRWMMTEYLGSLHLWVCTWLSQPTFRGFHHVEKLIFVSHPDFVTAEGYFEEVALWVAKAHSQVGSVVVTDEGIFRGLQRTVSDIDTIRFSRLDKRYSDNAYNDIQSNLDGIDTVLTYYDSTLASHDSAAALAAHAAVRAARTTLLAAGSLDALDIPAYRTHELADLNAAIRGAAAALSISLP